ncbi:MAG: hypothetical protein A2905_05695 [Candidatus Levybacteria bacterium RIFCSPLOWO2_01_FULL_36_10]|nr:MAG: hypothetical protein A2905_05695 [Candidatus Levybacteria bacterium RIFCSPLOWO2_01_FULL_36_10]
MIEEAEPEGIDPAVVNDLVGYASFGTRSLYVRSTEGRGQAFKQTIAHEILHLWFMRQMLDEGDPASDGVNETFVDTLALEGLRYFHLPRKAREPEIDGAINNSAIIKGVIERLGERGWEGLFRACQSGEQRQIASLMERTFGSQPKRALRQTNDSLQVVFGKNFWGRFKELALMTYLQRSDPTFQAKHRAVDHQMQLIIEWAQIDPKYLRELQ